MEDELTDLRLAQRWRSSVTTNFNALLDSGALPGDITLEQARTWMTRPEGQLFGLVAQLSQHTRSGNVKLRFCWAGEPPRDCPDDMLLEEFRTHVAMRRARIVVSDGDGGARVASEKLV